MRNFVSILIGLFFLSQYAFTNPDRDLTFASATRYETRKGNVVDTYFNHKVSSPYRWLENYDAEEVMEWVHYRYM